MHQFNITIPKNNPEEFEELSKSLGEAIIESEDEISVSFDDTFFKQNFEATLKLLEVAASIDESKCVIGGSMRSPNFVLGMVDTVRANEEKIKEELALDTDAPDGWGYSELKAVNRYLPATEVDWHKGLYWFQVGAFSGSETWQIDKNQIRAILKQEAEDKLLHLCPSFDFTRTESIINRLPDAIELKDNVNWSRVHIRKMEGSRIVSQASGIIHKLTKSGDSETVGDYTQKEEPKKPTRNIPKVTFSEIGGIDGVLSQVREVIELPLKNPGLFKHLGIKPHKGVLLYGAPGCGKTMIAKAIANEVKAHFISVKGPELLNKYYGQSEENVRKLFEEARDMEPSIIFFDEIDAIAQKRSSAETLRMDSRFVNQLLSLMDGIEDYGNVCVIAATNRKELIDDALLRPGRFDYHLEVKKPDEKGCRKILEISTKEMPVSEDIDLSAISKRLVGLSGADIAFIAREAAYNCLRSSLPQNGSFDMEKVSELDYAHLKITSHHFEKALESKRV